MYCACAATRRRSGTGVDVVWSSLWSPYLFCSNSTNTMAAKEQALILDPAGELHFKGPFTDVVTADLKLTNPTDRRICFKVKTTAPRRYCVRPNSGILDSQRSITVAVMLQPFDYDPNEKNKHKFMVQSMFAPAQDVDSQENLWKDAPPESLMDTKLKCVFELPDGPQQTISMDNAKSLESVPLYADSILDDSSRKVDSPKKSSSGTNVEEIRKIHLELKKAQAEILSLKSENSKLKDEGLRVRKLAQSDPASSAVPPHHASNSSSSTISSSGYIFPPVIYIIVAIFIGFIIGKCLL